MLRTDGLGALGRRRRIEVTRDDQRGPVEIGVPIGEGPDGLEFERKRGDADDAGRPLVPGAGASELTAGS